VNKKLAYTCSYSRSDIDWDKLRAIEASGVIIDNEDPNSGSVWSSLVMPLFTIAIGILIIVIFVRQMNASNRSAFDFGRTKAQIVTESKVRFTDVAGAEEEKLELQEIVDFLKSPKKFTELGAKIPRGVLLVGNPGTGKTLFAKAVAGEANVPFFSISGSDFVEMFVGVGASRVRDLFNTAKKNQPCIIFIDEIDAVGRQRGAGLGGGNDEREQTLNQLLVQLDGFESNEGIIVMAATNRADVLDPALLRPGRFDRQIYVNMPDVKGREAILKVHARNKPLAENVNFKILARMTGGFSGADLANLLNEAAILAARAGRKHITNNDLYEGINKVIIGPQKRSRLVTEPDKRLTAFHESGHAILAKLLPHCDPVQEVSIIPRGMAGGYTMTRPDNDDAYMTKSKLLDEIVMSMGGRAAEEIVIKEVTSGPSSDINHVTRIARKMVTTFGMNEKIGPVNYGDNEEIFVGRDFQTKAPYSEQTAKDIDEEVRKIINDGYSKAVRLLTENRKYLDTMARVLIERETIYTDEVNMIMEGKTAEEVISFMDSRDDINPLEKAVKDETASEKTEENAEKENIEEPLSSPVGPQNEETTEKGSIDIDNE
ncbi:MAG: ATP-dependent zinc metalloprotease FtsH, partial [Clostridia bacterium]|nr:ATP-dependent zinc metalloprotease FtsH [Clostridia bacterium]